MNRVNFWRPNEQQYVKDHWLTMSDIELGKVLGRTPGAVSTQRSHFELYRKAPPKDGTLASEIRHLWGTMPPSEIGERLGCSESRIRDIAAARGMGPSKFRKPSPVQNPAVRPDQPKGFTAAQLAWANANKTRHHASLIYLVGWKSSQADLILRMDAEGVLRVAM